MKKRKRGKNSPKLPGFGVVVFPDGTEIRPDEWGRSEKAVPHEPLTDLEADDDLFTAEDIRQRYGKYLDEDGVPLKGINPNPKYYVVPKEQPPKKVTVRKKKPAKKVTVKVSRKKNQ